MKTTQSKFIIGFVITIFVLYLLAFIVSKYYLDPEHIKKTLTQYLEQTFQKKANISGDVKLNISWDMSPHVVIDDLNIENTLNLHKLDLNFSLLKLLFKELYIKSLSIEQSNLQTVNIDHLVLHNIYINKDTLTGEASINKLSFGSSDPNSSGYKIPNQDIPVKQLAAANIDLDVKLKTIDLGSIILHNVDLKIFNKDDSLHLTFDPPANLANGNLNLDINYALKNKNTLKITLATQNLTLEALSKLMFNNSPVSGGDLLIKVDLTSSGTNVATLVNNLSGQILATSGPGQYLNNDASLGNLFSNILSAMITFDKRQSNTQFTCAVVNFKVNNGVASANNGIGLQASSVNVLGSGKIDLRNGQINFKINPQNLSNNPVDIAQFSMAQSISIQGTLDNPKVGFDPIAAITNTALGNTLVSSMAAGLPGGIASIAGSLIKPKDDKILEPCKTALGK